MKRTDPKFEPRHPIQVVARRTGLTPDVLRAWERRHGAVHPERGTSNRRLYSDADVERLTLLRRAAQAGRTIGQLSPLSNDELTSLLADDARAEMEAKASVVPLPHPASGRLVPVALAAVRALDSRALQNLLTTASRSLSAPEMVEGVLVPLMRSIGEEWRQGGVGPAHEHMASAIVRAVLSELALSRAVPETHPAIVVATPQRQLHEIGALVVAATAVSAGWRVTYLGADLPVAEIAVAANRAGARAVGISLTHPLDDSELPGDLRELRSRLAPGTMLLAGGLAVPGYLATLSEIGALVLNDVLSLSAILASLRGEHHGAAA